MRRGANGSIGMVGAGIARRKGWQRENVLFSFMHVCRFPVGRTRRTKRGLRFRRSRWTVGGWGLFRISSRRIAGRPHVLSRRDRISMAKAFLQLDNIGKRF